MPHPSKRRLVAALAAVMALGVVTACDSAADPAAGSKKGGTLRAIVSGLPAHLDPQRIGAALDSNVSRLISRTLTTFKAEPGAAGSELVADLATDPGRPSDNNKVWEFRLKDGVKWEDGTAINCQHLKYGAERNFSSLNQTGLPYARLYLADNPVHYEGPFKGNNNDGNGLVSVKCLDSKTIQYTLKQPVGDFNYTVALSIFAPVKLGADGDKDAYDAAPLASGPYKVKASARTKTDIVLVRNEHWDESTDKVRKAGPEEIQIHADANTPAVTNALIQDQGMDKNTVMLQRDVAPNFIQQVVNDPQLAARTAMGPSGAVRYFAINTKRIPDVRCRQALEFAFNKRKYRQAMGGSLLGDLATSMIPPNLRAHADFDHYETAATSGDGDPEQAEKLIAEAKADGVTCPTKITVATTDNPTIVRFVKTLVDAYLRIGVQVTLKTMPDASYFDDVSDSAGNHDLAYAGWIPDWANGSAVIPPLFSSTQVLPPGEIGGQNFAFFSNSEIDKAMDEIMLEPKMERQWKLWGDLDSKIQQLGVTIPVLYQNSIRLMGSNVANGYIHAAFGQPDLSSLALKDPGAVSGTPGSTGS